MAGNEAKIRLTAEDATAAAFATIAKNVNNVKSELAGLPAKFTQIAIASAGVGSIAGFASMIGGIIEARAKLKDLSIQSNISVEALSSLGKVAKYSNTSLDDVASASTKLSKALFSQNEDSKGAAAAIQAIGLSFDKFKSLSPDQQLYEIAKAFDNFQDSGEKSAAAMLLFGKQGALLLPFLKELSERGLDAAKVTTQQAEEAKKYEDNLIALKSAGDEWKKVLANDMTPFLVEFTDKLIESKKAYGDWWTAIKDLPGHNPFRDLSEDIADTKAQIKELDQGFATSQQKQKDGNLIYKLFGYSQSAYDDKRRELLGRLAYLTALDNKQRAKGPAFEANFPQQDKPKIAGLPNANPAAADPDALLRRIYQGQLKAAKDQLDQEKELGDFRNKILKGQYDDGLKSLADFYAEQGQIRDAGVAAELASIDKEIAAAKELRDKAAKPEDRQQAENAIADATARRTLIVQKAAHEETLANAENERQVKQTALAYYDFLAGIASMQGNAEQAFELTLPKKIEEARLAFAKFMSPEEAAAKAKALEPLYRSLDAVSRAQTEYGRLMDTLGVKEKSIQLEAEASGASELDTLRAIGAERQKQLPLLQAMADKALAAATTSPDAILAAQKLQLALKQAAAEADPLFLKIRDIGKETGQAVANDAEEALLHWQGVRNLLLAIEQDILRIATRKLFTEPFGNWLGNALGGNGQAAGGGGWIGSIFGKLFGLAGGSAGGGSSGGGVNLGDVKGSDLDVFFGGLTSLDVGTNYVPRDMVAMIHEGEAVVPKAYNAGGSGMSLVQNFTFSGPVDRRTQDQVAAAALSGAQRGLRRNG